MEENSDYILWLVSWYPSKVDLFNGDFIERHARAVAPHVPVRIIHVVKDESLKPGCVLMEEEKNGALSVYRAYYNQQPGVLGKLFSFLTYISLQKKIFKKLRVSFGLPALVHVHVAFKAGIFARYLRWKYALRYIVSEHWSGYYPGSAHSIERKRVTKRIVKAVLSKADYLLPVAKTLANELARFSRSPQIIIPNVVDTSVFYFAGFEPRMPTLVHVSNMVDVKNVEGIIRSAVELHEQGVEFKLMLIGAKPPSLVNIAAEAGALNRYVFFKEAISYADVAVYMQKATALVLFSRFESLPCVVLESLCCGVPIITSDVGGIHEVIDASNGVLVKSGDETALTRAMQAVVSKNLQFDREKISKEATAQFSYDSIGKELLQVYKKIKDETQ